MDLLTTRLRLRHFDHLDAPFVLKLVNSPGWLQYIGDRGIKTLEKAQEYLENMIINYDINPLGLSKVSMQSNDKPVGMCGILQRADLPYPDIGYALLPDAESKGYASEMVAAVISRYFEHKKTTRLLALVHPDNVRSIHLLCKTGFEKTNIIWGSKDETVVYELNNQGQSPEILMTRVSS